jgi:hypothetical protein
MSNYAEDLERLFQDLELRKRDAELSEEAQRREEAAILRKWLVIHVDLLGYAREEALDLAKRSGRFPASFSAPPD